MQAIHEVVIIGAGIAAIGASLELSKNKVEHIIIEARDRIGGRIASQMFDGVEIQLGASYVHKPHIHNRIADLMKERGWKSKPVGFGGGMAYAEGVALEDSKDYNEAAYELYEQLETEFKKVLQDSSTDLSIDQASQPFLKRAEEEKRKDLLLLKWSLTVIGNMAGTEASQLSAREHTYFESEEDVIAEGGYASLVEKIFKEVTAEVKLNQKVSTINYSENVIRIYTNDNIYLARTVISSLPLGVMQNHAVEFVPPIPDTHEKIIQKIGNGNANKLFVSFEEPFWDVTMQWLYFLPKDGYNRYPTAAAIYEGGRFILCFFLSGEINNLLAGLTDKQIVDDLLNFLAKFNLKELKVKDYLATRWHNDPLSQGSYSFFKVGLTVDEVDSLRSPIDNKIWFVGQHCRPEDISCTHAAFETGVWAAQQISKKLN